MHVNINLLGYYVVCLILKTFRISIITSFQKLELNFCSKKSVRTKYTVSSHGKDETLWCILPLVSERHFSIFQFSILHSACKNKMHPLITLSCVSEGTAMFVRKAPKSVFVRATNDLHVPITSAVCSGNNSATVHKGITAYRIYSHVWFVFVYQWPFRLLVGS
jgi:hypothetical protein